MAAVKLGRAVNEYLRRPSNRICQLIILEQKYRMIKNKINNNTVVLSYHLIAKSYWQGKSVMPLISFEKHKCNYSEKKQIQWRAGVYD